LRVLISVVNELEALKAFSGGADIVDVKNPLEGALGAPEPNVVKKVRKILPSTVEVSTAIGDMPYMPGTAAQAALGAAYCGVNYVKVGVYGPRTLEQAYKLINAVYTSIKEYDKSVKVVAAGYADHKRLSCLSPLEVLKAAIKVGCEVFMVDTKVKDGKSLLDFIDKSSIANMVDEAHEHGLTIALAGSLSKPQIPQLLRLGADILGFRTAACGGDRIKGSVEVDLVAELVKAVKRG